MQVRLAAAMRALTLRAPWMCCGHLGCHGTGVLVPSLDTEPAGVGVPESGLVVGDGVVADGDGDVGVGDGDGDDAVADGDGDVALAVGVGVVGEPLDTVGVGVADGVGVAQVDVGVVGWYVWAADGMGLGTAGAGS